ncbi:MAG: hypothetical protein OES57_04715 [Acidimicrobiia bacterium]|nr:hypothetical protein [Acidimicrobiia bacterium]
MAAQRRGPWASLAVFVLVLIGINAVLGVLGVQIRISIIGSIILSVIVGGIMAASNR